ncbi:hypothetical protein Taro_050496 [Colocasia esculenta]|uniref:Uncharacterized protein n=1 Tax=Colocasia esculenta TaxID=4460 RepID=A0A843XDL0_COLES|nr:hypothetical protein [Colocasia esculenta]
MLISCKVVSTLDQVVSTPCSKHKTKSCKTENLLGQLGQCVDTSSDSVDTRDLPRTSSGQFWDSVSTLNHLVSTLVPFQNKQDESGVTRNHISYSDSLSLIITL